MRNKQTNEGSVKQSSTPSTKIKDRLFSQLGDTSYGDFTDVKRALEEGDFQRAWNEFESEKDRAEDFIGGIDRILSEYETSI